MSRILIIDQGQLDVHGTQDLIRRAEIVLVRTAGGFVCRKWRYGNPEDVQVREVPNGDVSPFTFPPAPSTTPRPLVGASG